jgi:hypothetical protein
MIYICNIPKEFCNLRESDGSCRLKRPCSPIVTKCIEVECDRIDSGYCKVYINPSAKWSHEKLCPMAPIKIEESQAGKVRIGQQKQRRRKK